MKVLQLYSRIGFTVHTALDMEFQELKVPSMMVNVNTSEANECLSSGRKNLKQKRKDLGMAFKHLLHFLTQG